MASFEFPLCCVVYWILCNFSEYRRVLYYSGAGDGAGYLRRGSCRGNLLAVNWESIANQFEGLWREPCHENRSLIGRESIANQLLRTVNLLFLRHPGMPPPRHPGMHSSRDPGLCSRFVLQISQNQNLRIPASQSAFEMVRPLRLI